MLSTKGYGLIEVMLSIVLASLLLGYAFHNYQNVKQTQNRLQHKLEQASEIHWVFDFIRDSVQPAGFTPCLNLRYLDTVNQLNGQTHLSGINILGDRLEIRRMHQAFSEVVVLNSHQILLKPALTLTLNMPIMIADCYQAEVNQVTALQATPQGQVIHLLKPLKFNYSSPLYVGEWVEHAFFIHTLHKQARLYYSARHPEELAPWIRAVNWEIISQYSQYFVTAKFILHDNTQHNLTILVRA